MQELLFCIMLDGSNDNGLAKIYPIAVKPFDINYFCVMTKFFDMNLIEGAIDITVAVMFSSLDS